MLLVVTGVLLLGHSGFRHYSRHYRGETELLENNEQQLILTIDGEFRQLENASLLTASITEIHDYSDAALGEQDRSSLLTGVSQRVTALSFIDNYCDFAVMFSDDQSAGKLSQGTKDDLGTSQPYRKIAGDLLGSENSLWLSGLGGDSSKIYYFRRIDDNAIFIGSFYISELERNLASTKESGIGIYVLDRNGRTICTTSEENRLKYELPDGFENGGSYTVTDDKYILACGTLRNGWRLVAVRDMEEDYNFYRRVLTESGAIMGVSVVILIVFNILLTQLRDAGSLKARAPEEDPLTGLYKAEEAENLIADRIDSCDAGATVMLALVRVTNLSEIDENFGTSGHNGSLIKTSHVLCDFFGTLDGNGKNVVGRTGTNEFVIFADYTQYDLFKAHDELEKGLMDLAQALGQVWLAEPGDVKFTIGAAVYPDSSKDYDELYELAAVTLGKAAAEGHTFMIHSPEKKKDGKEEDSGEK